MDPRLKKGTKTKTINGVKAILLAIAPVIIGMASMAQGWKSFTMRTVGFLMAAVALYFDLKHRHFKQRTAVCWAVVLVVIGVFLGWVLFVPIPPQPHFKLVLRSTTDRPKLNLELTNRLLFTKDGAVYSTTDMTEVLVVPVRPGQSNVVLNFILMPDSPADCDVAEIVITIAKYVDWAPATGWFESECVGVPPEMAKCISTKFDLRNLLPFDWVELPSLTFNTANRPTGEKNVMSPISIRLRAKGMPPVFCGFWLMIPELSDAPEPRLVHVGKLGDSGFIKIPFPQNRPGSL